MEYERVDMMGLHFAFVFLQGVDVSVFIIFIKLKKISDFTASVTIDIQNFGFLVSLYLGSSQNNR